MKAKVLLCILVAVFLFTPPVSVFALNLGGGLTKDVAGQAGYARSTNETTFAETLGVVVKGALSLVGVIFLILMVYAGFLWMTAHGGEEQIEKAQEIIRSSIIGLIITLGAYSITAFVLPRILERTTGQSGGSSVGVSCPLQGGQTGVCAPSGNCPGGGVGITVPACPSGQYCCNR